MDAFDFSQFHGVNFNTILLLSSFVVACGVLWKVARFVFRVDNALPTLLNIAHQFESNTGSTIKDKIDQLIDNQENLKAADLVAVAIAKDSKLIAETNAAIVNELTRTQGQDLLAIKDFLKETNSGMQAEMNKLAIQLLEAEKRFDRIEFRLDNMLPFIQRTRKGDSNEGRLPND